MTQKRSNLVNVGRVTGVFGIKGWLKVVSNTDPAENILAYRPWWIKTRFGVKEVEVDQSAHRSGGLAVHFKGVDDRDQAALYALSDIAIEKSQLPVLEDGDFYWHQLVGLTVITEFDGQRVLLGQVKELFETGANDVMVVVPCEGSVDQRERLLPYVPELYVRQVDLAGGEVLVNWDPAF